MVSVDFLASEFIAKEELPTLLAAAQEEGARILPVILTPCLFRRTKLSIFQTVNDPARPLSLMKPEERDLIWEQVVEQVLDALKTKEDWLKEGAMFAQDKQYEEALAAYEQAIKIDPTYVDAYRGKADLLHNIGRYTEALAFYEKACELDPNNAFVVANKANTLNHLQRYEEALKVSEQALSLNPNVAFAFSTKGVALYNLKRYTEALAAFEKACELDPNNPLYIVNKANTLRELKR